MLYFIVNYIPMNSVNEGFVVVDDDYSNDSSGGGGGGGGGGGAFGSKGLTFVRLIDQISHTFNFFHSRK
jgi:hypothetical protein